MATNDLKGRVDLDVAGALGALKAAQRAFRDLEKASTDAGSKMTASQKAATTAIINEYRKLRAEQSKAVDNAIAVDRKMREMERNGVNNRSNSRKITDAKVDQINSGTEDKSLESRSKVALNDARAVTEEKRQQVMLTDLAGRVTSRQLRDELALRKQIFREQQALNRAAEAQSEHLNATRYALYDVSRMMVVAGAGAVALEAASLGVAVAWERDFADVIRTTGAAGPEIQRLKADFVDLAQTIPETWASLTQIGTLAGQLGIPKSEITDFTSVVAKFAATTDVSVQDAATAFGRLDSLLSDVDGNYEGVANAILKVGVNSVATESQIVRIATQISALGSQAGFSYDEIIGLAGALASVAVPPELARGVVTRVFGQIGRATAQGGANLERFGRIAGMSGAEFRKAWSEDAGGTFIRFMKGIQEQGGNAESAIRELGITSVRDVPILIRLANAANSAGEAGGLIAQSFGDAADSVGEMDRQYEIISGTVSAKIQVFQNTLQSLLDTIGGAQLGPLGVVLDTVTEHLRQLQEFAGSDWGWILGVGAALTAVAGVLILLGGLAARGVAGYAALITALQGLQTSATGAGISMASLNGMLAATGPLGSKAATAIRIVSTALKALAAVTIVLALPDLVDWANEGIMAMRGLETSASATFNRLTKQGEKFKALLDDPAWTQDFSNFWNGIPVIGELGLDDFTRDLRAADDEFKLMVEQGNVDEVHKQLARFGLTNQDLSRIMPETYRALKEAGEAAGDTSGLYGEAALEAEGLAQAEQEAAEATQALYDVFAGGSTSFVSLGDIIGTLQSKTQEWAEAQADATDNADDTWQSFYDGQSINMTEYLAELQAQVDAQTNWETNMTLLAGRVSDNTLAELGRLGPEGAPLVAALVTASDEELAKFDTLFAQAGTDAGTAFAVALVNTQTLINDVGRVLGDGAKAELMTRLAAGEDFNKLLAEYTTKMNELKFEVPAPGLTKAQKAVDDFLYKNGGKTISVLVDAVPGRYDPNTLFKKQFNGGLAGRGFAGGGYTGDGGRFDPAGIVHRGEFVFTKKATQAIGLQNLYAMMNAGERNGFAGGGIAGHGFVPSFGGSSMFGGAGGVTSLDAASLQALTQAFIKAVQSAPIKLYTTDRVLADSNNRGTAELARQGTN